MNIQNPKIKKLLNHYKEISNLQKIKSVLDWDLNVNLPPKGAQARAEETAYLTEKLTNLWLDKEFISLIKEANNENNLNLEEKAILRNLNYFGKYYFKVPSTLIIELSKVTSEAFIIWRSAREENNFKKFLSPLKKIIELNKDVAKYLGYKNNPYEALLY